MAKLKYKGLLKKKKTTLNQSVEHSTGNENERKDEEYDYRSSSDRSKPSKKPKEKDSIEERLDVLEKGEAMFEGAELPKYTEVEQESEEGQEVDDAGKENDGKVTIPLGDTETKSASKEAPSGEPSKSKRAKGGCLGCGGKMYKRGGGALRTKTKTKIKIKEKTKTKDTRGYAGGGYLNYKAGGYMGIDPDHAGYCTPMTKDTCTPHRKALAKRLKPGGDLYKGTKKAADGGWLAAQGRGGDTELAHVNKFEKNLLESLGGSGTINPKTGLKEFVAPVIAAVAGGAGAAGGAAAGGTAAAGAGAGAGTSALGSQAISMASQKALGSVGGGGGGSGSSQLIHTGTGPSLIQNLNNNPIEQDIMEGNEEEFVAADGGAFGLARLKRK